VSYYAGVAFAIIVLPLLLAKVAHLVSRRSSRVANVVFLVVLTLAVAGQGARASRGARDKAVVDQMVADSREGREALQRQIDEKGYVDGLAEAGERNAKLLEDAGAKASPESRSLLNAGAAITRRLTELSVPYNDAMKEFVEAGGCGPAGLASAADVRARLVLVERVGETNTELLKYLRGMQAETARQMRATGVPEDRIPSNVQAFMRGMHHPLLVQIYELDVEFVTAAREHFEILLEHDGKWSLNGDEFQASDAFPNEAIERFSKSGERLDDISTRQAALIEELKARQIDSK
jgi:hypothetical protein